MKKLLILALVLLASNSYAQTDTSTHAQKAEYLFQNIAKPTTAGIWHDKAVSSIGLPYYGTKKDDRSNTAHWQQAYYELLVAKGERSKFDAFLQNKLKRKAVGTIPLGLIDANIYFLDTTAIKNGIITQKTADMPFTRVKEGQVFQEKQIIVVSLLNDAPLQANKSYKIELSSDFFLKHLAKNSTQITLTIEGKEHSFTPPL